MVNTVPDPELEMGGGGGEEWATVIQTLRKGGGGRAGSLDPSPGSVTLIMRGRIIMAMRTVYVEYCKLPLIRLPTFKPFPPTYVPIYS